MQDDGERPDLAALYGQLAPAIYRRARALLKGEAESWDVVHEVFRKLLEDPGAFRGNSSPLTYCYRMTTNLCLNRLKALRIRERQAHLEPGDAAYEPAQSEARELIMGILDRLDADDLQVAVLHFFDGLSQEEIAQVVGHTRKTVGLALQRVRAVASALASEEPGNG